MADNGTRATNPTDMKAVGAEALAAIRDWVKNQIPTVDAVLDPASENAIQNQAVVKALEDYVTKEDASGYMGAVLKITFESVFSGQAYTVTGGGESYSGVVPSDLVVRVTVKPEGLTTYTITSTPAGSEKTFTTTQDVQYFGVYPVTLVANRVFGVMWDYSKADPDLTRLTSANDPNHVANFAPPTEPVAAFGTSEAGSSPFNQYLPWSGMERVNISGAGEVTNADSSSFSYSNNTFVSIPVFYYRVIDDVANSKRYWYVTAEPDVPGFTKHPGSGSYIARYECGSSTHGSKTKETPQTSKSLTQYRTYAKEIGAGFRTCDYPTYCAVVILALVEYATMDIGKAIGYGTNAAAKVTGGTDNMIYHTGSAASDYSPMQYRWIENLIGNTWKMTDGLLVNKYSVYICEDPDKYADTITSDYIDTGLRAIL